MQVNAGYIEADGSQKEHCGVFTRAMRAGPLAAMRNMTNKFGNISDIAEGMAKGAFSAASAKGDEDSTKEEAAATEAKAEPTQAEEEPQ